LGVALGFAEMYRTAAGAPWFPALPTYLALLLAASIAFQAVALIPRAAAAAQLQATHAAALMPVVSLLTLTPVPDGTALSFLAGTLALGLLAALAATRLAIGAWLLAATLATGFVHDGWTNLQHGGTGMPDELVGA